MRALTEKWLSDKPQLPCKIRPYFLQEEISHQDDIVFRGKRAVIPDALMSDITSQLHSSHLCVEGYLRIAREGVYWLCMNDQIKQYIPKYDNCRSLDNKQKDALIPMKCQADQEQRW